jgi:predicted lysophospholipase L1 biosynthesis ABC-type transport system permease subunit
MKWAAGSPQEIGIRVALGAQRSDVPHLVMGEGARLAADGVAIGIAASFVSTRLLSRLLFGVSAMDPITFAGVAMLFSLVALLASYLPARRAMRLDPSMHCATNRRFLVGRSILRGSLHLVDDEDLYRAFRRLHFQTKLIT